MLRYLMALLAVCVPGSALAQNSTVPSLPQTQCRVLVNPSPPSWIIRGYDPFDNTAAEATFNVVFLNEGGEDCTFSPNFELTQPPFGLANGAGRPIRYTILNLTDTQDVTPRAGRSQRRSASRAITLEPRESRSILYKLVVDPRDIRNSGTFTQDVTLAAQDSTFRSFGGSQIVLGLTVLPSARIGLAGAYTLNEGQALVDLGELRRGPAPVPLNLRVNSTGRYEISVTSANSGKLRLGNSNWSIDYDMVIGGHSVNLNGRQSVASTPGEGLRQDSLPVQFIIGDTSDRRAGRYSDVISVSITAR